MVDTPNLGLPYILAAQSQKHVPHNEAIRALDAIVQLSVLDRSLTAPPATPAEGDRYIVASSPTGAWTGQAEKIAAYQDGAWMFYAPKEGWISWVADENIAVAFDGAAWTALSAGGGGGGVTDHGALTGLGDDDHPQYHNNARGDARYTALNPAILGINATADTTNRLSVGSAASLFNHAGTGGHQIKINKAAVADTASFLFQDNFSGRAEIGLTGDDDFHFKVSPNGTAFNEAIIINRTTGACSFPNTSFGGVTDGDKGDVTVSGTGAVWTVDADAVTNAKLMNVPTATFKGRVTAATGDPEDLTVAQAKTLLNLTGTNSGDQTSIAGITGTLAQFNTACTDADFASGGGTITGTSTGTNTGDQTITLTGAVTGSGTGSFATAIANNAVDMTKLADAPAYTLLLRDATTTGDPAYVKISALTDRTAVGAGDKLMIEESSGELRKIDWSDLPGASGGISNGYATVTDGTTPANASGADTFKLRAGAGLSVAVQNNDATHGDNALFAAEPRRSPIAASDFLGTTVAMMAPFNISAISTGTFTTAPAAGVVTGNHPGVLLFRSSTTANSGVIVNTTQNIVLVQGGEQFDCVFRTPAALTNLTYRLGFHDTATSADAVDGIYFEMPASGAIVGKTSSNSVRTTSGTIATLVANTWYHGRIVVNAAGTGVDFFIFSDAGTQLGTANITTNIPTASGRETGVAFVGTSSGTTAVDVVNLDYMAAASPGRTLVRGALS